MTINLNGILLCVRIRTAHHCNHHFINQFVPIIDKSIMKGMALDSHQIFLRFFRAVDTAGSPDGVLAANPDNANS